MFRMSRYRIVKVYTVVGEFYIVEKRVLFFFWLQRGGNFRTKDDAKEFITILEDGEV